MEAYRTLTGRLRADQACEYQAQKDHWAMREKERSWLAILVVTDNCTRLCLGLPIFESGAKVTAQEVAEALNLLLPKNLAFLISDQGTHFRSKALAELAQYKHFVQIPIYRHRPQTNGNAERFVRSLKERLRHSTWTGADEVTELISAFQPFYNNRPDQGLHIPGLSPNEFDYRLWLM